MRATESPRSSGNSATVPRMRRVFDERMRDWALVAVLGLAALALDLHLLNSTSVWYDESFTYIEIAQPFSGLWHDISTWTPNMGLYYVLLYGWVHAAAALGVRTSEAVLRLPSALCAALTVPVVYALGCRFWRRTTGIVGAALCAVNPMQIYYAQQARAYSLEVLLTCIGWYALLAALSAPREGLSRHRWWVGYSTTVVLGMYAHVLTALFVAAQLAAFGSLLALSGPWRESALAGRRDLVASLGAAGLLVAPLLFVGRAGGTNGWVSPVGLGNLGSLVRESVAGGSLAYLTVVGVLSALAAFSTLIGTPDLRRLLSSAPRIPRDVTAPRLSITAKPDGSSAATATPPPMPVLLCWLLVPVALAFALTQPFLNLHVFVDRYLVAIVPVVCLLAAIGLTSLRELPARLVLMATLTAVALPLVPAYYGQADTGSFRAATRWIEARYQPGDGIACYPAYWCTFPMRYYLQTSVGPAHLDADSPSDRLDTQALASYAAKHRRVFMIVATFNPNPSPPTTASAPPVDHLQAWVDTHCQLVGQMASFHSNYQFIARDMLTGVQVRLYAMDVASG